MNGQHCGNCLYWRRWRNELANEGVADCRRHALGTNTQFYPQSVRDHWCGDWEARTEKPAAPRKSWLAMTIPEWWHRVWTGDKDLTETRRRLEHEARRFGGTIIWEKLTP